MHDLACGADSGRGAQDAAMLLASALSPALKLSAALRQEVPAGFRRAPATSGCVHLSSIGTGILIG